MGKEIFPSSIGDLYQPVHCESWALVTHKIQLGSKQPEHTQHLRNSLSRLITRKTSWEVQNLNEELTVQADN